MFIVVYVCFPAFSTFLPYVLSWFYYAASASYWPRRYHWKILPSPLVGQLIIQVLGRGLLLPSFHICCWQWMSEIPLKSAPGTQNCIKTPMGLHPIFLWWLSSYFPHKLLFRLLFEAPLNTWRSDLVLFADFVFPFPRCKIWIILIPLILGNP